MQCLPASLVLVTSLLVWLPLNGEEVEAVKTAGIPTLLEKSPFLPPGFQPPGGAGAAAAPAAQAGQFEFRGVYQLGGEYFFNLYNTRERKGSWVSKNASGEETPKIIEFDLENDVLVVDSSGQRLSLNLVETSDNPMPLSANRPVTTPSPTTLPATPAATAEQRTTPARRRVIRPSTRPASTTTAAPRRVIRPTTQTPNP